MRDIDPTASEWISSGYIENSAGGKRKYDPASIFSTVAPTVIGGLLGGASGGSSQGGTQTFNRDPWSAADPWLRQQIQTGQQLQGYYQRNPFNQQQQNAYGLLSNGNDYVNQLMPSLLGQISGQPGFNRANPSARPAGVNFNVPNLGYGAPPMQNQASPGNMNVTNNPFTNGGIQPPAPAAPAPQAPAAPVWNGPDWLAHGPDGTYAGLGTRGDR